MSTFEDRLAIALRAYAAEQEAARRARRARVACAGRQARPAPDGAPRRRARRRRGDVRGRALGVAPLAAAPRRAACSLLVPGRDPAPASAAELLRSAATAAEQRGAAARGGLPLRAPRVHLAARARARDGGVEERWTRADGSGRTLVRDRSGRVVEDTRRKAGFVVGSETRRAPRRRPRPAGAPGAADDRREPGLRPAAAARLHRLHDPARPARHAVGGGAAGRGLPRAGRDARACAEAGDTRRSRASATSSCA